MQGVTKVEKENVRVRRAPADNARSRKRAAEGVEASELRYQRAPYPQRRASSRFPIPCMRDSPMSVMSVIVTWAVLRSNNTGSACETSGGLLCSSTSPTVSRSTIHSMEDPHADDVLPWGNAATADSRCEIAFDVSEKEGDEAVDRGLLLGVQNTQLPAGGVAPSPPTPPLPTPHPPPSDSRPSPSLPPSPSPAPPPPGIRLVTEESMLSSLDTCSNTSNGKTGAFSFEEVVMLPGMVAGERARTMMMTLCLQKHKPAQRYIPTGYLPLVITKGRSTSLSAHYTNDQHCITLLPNCITLLPNCIDLDLARLHAMILTSPAPLSRLRL